MSVAAITSEKNGRTEQEDDRGEGVGQPKPDVLCNVWNFSPVSMTSESTKSHLLGECHSNLTN